MDLIGWCIAKCCSEEGQLINAGKLLSSELIPGVGGGMCAIIDMRAVGLASILRSIESPIGCTSYFGLDMQ